MYNNHGRSMRLLSHLIIFGFMGIIMQTSHAYVGTVLLSAVEAIVIWGTLPDLRSTKRGLSIWIRREVTIPYWVPFWYGRRTLNKGWSS